MNLKLVVPFFSLAMTTLLGTAYADDTQVQELAGKWEVVLVDRDGVHRHGEVGQEPGDMITINVQADVSAGINQDVKNLFEGRASEDDILAGMLPNEIDRPVNPIDGVPGFPVVMS